MTNEEHKPPEDIWDGLLETGFTQVPTVLFQKQSELKLHSTEVIILLNLVSHWWTKDSLPYPRPAQIAKRIGVDSRTVQRKIRGLQSRGFIKKMPSEKLPNKQTVTRYDPSGLIKKLKEHAMPLIEFRRQKREESAQNRGNRNKEVFHAETK